MKIKLLLSLVLFNVNISFALNDYFFNYVYTLANKPCMIKKFLYNATKCKYFSADAFFILGTLYLDGNILKKNLQLADWYITKAYNMGLPEAIHSIGDAYYTGDIRKKNVNKALYCYKKAAKLGYGPSQFNAGIIQYKFALNNYGIHKSIYYLNMASKNVKDLGEITNIALRYKNNAKKKLHSIK